MSTLDPVVIPVRDAEATLRIDSDVMSLPKMANPAALAAVKRWAKAA